MSFLRRFKGALSSDKNKNQKIPKSVSCGNISQSGPSFDLPDSRTGPLADFIAENEISCSVDLGQATPSWTNLVKQKSRLSKTTIEVLHDHSALGYFIQYLEARDAVQLVKFWLDVESFRSSASTVITTSFIPPKVSRERLQIVPEFPDVESRLPEGSESTESFDSGFGRAEFDASGDSRLDCEELQSPTETDSKVAMSVSSILTHPEKEISRAEHIVKTRTEDAVKIYRRYIAPDCQRPVHLPTEYKRDIVELICAETGHVAPDCFDSAQEKVVDILETEYFPDFLKSEFHAKHLVDVLTGGQVYLTDILYNDTALSHFMEFLESENKRPLIEFWLAATNFNQTVTSDNLNNSQGDAMILYDKYFSMQASSPLGFNDSIRLHIENNICTEGGPDHTCFHKPLEIIVKYLEKQYLARFLESSMYKNYVKELIGTITASPRSFNSVHSISCPSSVRSRTDSHSDTHSDCSSDFSSGVGQGAIGSHRNNNTLLAMSSGQIFRNVDRKHLSFDKETTDPDMLWKRNPIRNKVGRINSFGRYEPGWDLAPEMSRADGTKKASRFSKAVKKLVTNDEHEKLKEEMAWQVAEMIVRDVTSITMPEKSQKKRTNSIEEDSQVPGTSGKAGESSDSMMRKSMSESLSLADSSLSALEIPTAKYF
eukprot:TRINITY_DN11880_c0_g1_i1.p1 TRINITY_DN11880_c0_g1~~TRINITY_DN11880_c0_g1_i1.p1  ORF type:complete len:656 (-),score=205.40 TRINITY_DN11880_c0_g1_i1:231-2198(-)